MPDPHLPPLEELCRYLKAEMKRRRLTQIELARRRGGDQPYMSRVLNLKAGNPSYEYLQTLLDEIERG